MLPSFHRINLLTSNHLKENVRWYTIMSLIYLGVSTLLLIAALRMDDAQVKQSLYMGIFTTLPILAGAVLATLPFRELRQRTMVIQNLLLPVSAGDRLVSAIIVSGFFGGLLLMVLFFMANLLACTSINLFGAPAEYLAIGTLPQDLYISGFTGTIVLNLILGLLSTQAFFLFGAARFREHSAALSFLIFFGYILIIAIANGLVSYYHFKEISFEISERMDLVNHTFSQTEITRRALLLTGVKWFSGLSMGLWWAATYYTLKEKEVKNNQ